MESSQLSEGSKFMLLCPYGSPLEKGNFLKRYKRFFVDILRPSQKEEEENEIITAHCANSGSMKSCLVDGANAYLLDSKNLKRKLRYSLELLELEDGLACLNTQRANKFIFELFKKTIGEKQTTYFQERDFPYFDFIKWNAFKGEVSFNKNTRFDFCLTNSSLEQKCWVEVKSVSLQLGKNTWGFPDAVTERGQKHLRELIQAKKNGDEAWLFFVMMRGSLISPQDLYKGFQIAREIDKEYGKQYDEAQKAGVQMALVIPEITLEGFSFKSFFKLTP